MAKTYIEMVNHVLDFSRDGSTTAETSLTANDDVILIAALLNEAKREVEDAWKWNALRATITFDTVADTSEYDTSLLATVSSDPVVTEERSELLEDPENGLPLFWDVTAGREFRMNRRPRERVLNELRRTPDTVEQPGTVAVFPNVEGLTVLFQEIPTGVRSYSFEVYTPQADLAATTDEITVPWRPVVLRATSLFKADVGEEFGGPALNYQAMFEDSLQTHIAREQDEFDLILRVT